MSRDAYNTKFTSIVLKALYNLNVSFHLISSRLLFSSQENDEEEFDMCGYVKECQQFCHENDIDVAIATRDMADICHAAYASYCQINTMALVYFRSLLHWTNCVRIKFLTLGQSHTVLLK